MNSGITINISLSQIATFFTVAGVGTIIVSSLLVNEWVNERWSTKARAKIIGCASAIIAGALFQAVSSVFLYFKQGWVKRWVYTQVGIILLNIICFTILLADSNVTTGTSPTDTFFAVLGVNWILTFLTVGFLSKNSVPVGIMFTILGVAVIISCSLVIDDFANATGSSYGDKIVGCSAAAMVAGFAQTISSAFLFFKDDMKTIWMYTNTLVTIALVVCFAVPMAGGVKDYLSMNYFYTTLAIDFVFLAVVVGVLISLYIWDGVKKMILLLVWKMKSQSFIIIDKAKARLEKLIDVVNNIKFTGRGNTNLLTMR